MKKMMVFIVVLFALTGTGFPETDSLKIGFWNVRDLSESSRDCVEIALIASVIHNFDCVAIAEINDRKVLSSLVMALETIDGQWDKIQTPAKIGNTTASSEYYGVVFRADKLRVIGQPYVLEEKTYIPEGENEPRKFDREPYVSTFQTLDNRMDFTLIVVHITWGNRVAYRKGEIGLLKDYFVEVREKDSDNDIILTGDFNRNVGDASFSGLLNIDGMIDAVNAGPTKIKSKNSYDHVFFQTVFLSEYVGESGIIKFDETLFSGNDDNAKRACSDHRPVWIDIQIPEIDDD